MKTTMIRLMVMMFTLAAVITATPPRTEAQGRTQRGNPTVESRSENRGKNHNGELRDESISRKGGSAESYARKPENPGYGQGNKFKNPRDNKDGIRPESTPRKHDNFYRDDRNPGGREWDRNYGNNDLRAHRHYYHHPSHGQVIRHFDTRPLEFRYGQGSIFYGNGHFFCYRPGIGYIVIDYPYNHVFNNLPYGAIRFVFRGHLYFKVGNLVFEAHRHGYRLVPFHRDVYRYTVHGNIFTARF